MNTPAPAAVPVAADLGQPDSRDFLERADRLFVVLAAVACASLVLYKFALIRLQNLNWDEFYFLSHVYSLARGELSLLMLGAYTHLFSWLLLVPGHEIQQLLMARVVMTLLLLTTAWLVWRLARVWLSGSAALVPPFVYLSAMPVLHHGGSFRFDSMLAPLSVAALVLLMTPGRDAARVWLAAALLGLAFTITVKVVLFAPLFFLACLFQPAHAGPSKAAGRSEVAGTLVRLTIGASASAALLLFLHSLTIVESPANSIVNFATQSARKTLLETPWFPRLMYLDRYVDWQPLPWLLIAIGAVIALLRRRLALASLVLALLPIAFYRNAFPYYYVVMLAPASVLAGYALQGMVSLVQTRANPRITAALLATIWTGLLYQGLAYTGHLRFDEQAVQRQVVSGVHEIFTKPVNYIDRCGMISSFRKVNFFVSTWGLEVYRAQGEPFMPEAIRTARPAFVVMNVAALAPGRPRASGLLEPDRLMLQRFYPRYWGPVRVAGAQTRMVPGEPQTLEVPFAAEYRLEADRPLLIDGAPRHPGDTFRIQQFVTVEVQARGAVEETIPVKLFLATARPRPAGEPDPQQIFTGL
jgi:hypothetical protein